MEEGQGMRALMPLPAFQWTSALTKRPELEALVAELEEVFLHEPETVTGLGGTFESHGYRVLKKILAASTEAEVVALLWHRAPIVRAYVITGIAARYPERLGELERLLGDDAEVQRAGGGCVRGPASTVSSIAAEAIAWSQSPMAAPLRLALLASERPSVRRAMAERLVREGDAVLREALAGLSGEPLSELQAAVIASGRSTPTSVALGLQALGSALDPASILALSGGTDAASLARLRELMTHPDPEIGVIARLAVCLRPETSRAERAALASEEAVWRALQAASEPWAGQKLKVSAPASIEDLFLADPVRFSRALFWLSSDGDKAALRARLLRLAPHAPVGVRVERGGFLRFPILSFLSHVQDPSDAWVFEASLESDIPDEVNAALYGLRAIGKENVELLRAMTERPAVADVAWEALERLRHVAPWFSPRDAAENVRVTRDPNVRHAALLVTFRTPPPRNSGKRFSVGFRTREGGRHIGHAFYLKDGATSISAHLTTMGTGPVDLVVCDGFLVLASFPASELLATRAG